MRGDRRAGLACRLMESRLAHPSLNSLIGLVAIVKNLLIAWILARDLPPRVVDAHRNSRLGTSDDARYAYLVASTTRLKTPIDASLVRQDLIAIEAVSAIVGHLHESVRGARFPGGRSWL